MSIDSNNLIFIATLLLFNLGSIVGSFISTKISIAKIETLVGILQKEIDELKRATQLKGSL